MSKQHRLKILGCLCAAIFLITLGFLAAGHRAAVPLPVRLAEELPVTASEKVTVQKEELQNPDAALSWLFEVMVSSEPALKVTESSRVMYNGSLSWKRVWLKGVSGDIKNLAAILESSRVTLLQDFNYQLLMSCELDRGSLNFLLIHGSEVAVVANFIAAGLKVDLKSEPECPKLAIVIDDLGRSLKSAVDFASLDIPLTFAVFPKLSESHAVAGYFISRQRDIMLHMPMEPRDFPAQNPGPGAIFMGMDAQELQQEVLEDLASVPGIIGINNHMGSRLTADSQKMDQVMATLKGRNLFFLDSRTIADSVAYKSALKAGIPALQRDVFLDNDRDVEKILDQFLVLIEIAKVKKQAIGIGHPYPETLKALTKVSEIADSAGVEIVPVRNFLHSEERVSGM